MDRATEGTDGADSWREYVRSQLPPLLVSAERESDIVEELAVQLESTYERARSRGISEEEAKQLALNEVPDWRAFAHTVGAIERPYTPPPALGAGAGGIMTGFIQDIRYALRALMRAPGFAAVSIVTLALGIAATTIVYSIADAILLRPLPIERPDRVVLARELIRGTQDSISWPNFLDWRDRQQSFSHFAVWRGMVVNFTGGAQPRRLNARQVSANLFATLGVRPILGRDFTADDDRFGVDRTALVSHGFWRRELGGGPDAIGRRIILDEIPVTVIGVLPRDFTMARVEDIFLPWGNFLDPKIDMFFKRGNHFGLAVIARLNDGVSLTAADTELQGIARQLALEHPDSNAGNGAIARPIHEVLIGQAPSMLYVLLGAVAFMLLIACVNLANLMLARGASRTHEMAVRRSLGAERWRIARQVLTESVMLSLIGGAIGVALAYAGFEALVAVLPPTQGRIHTVAIDGRVLFVAAAASIGTGLLFGLMPSIHAATGRAMASLRSTRVTGGRMASRTGRVLMLSEIALALVLVTGAGLMLRTMNNLLAIDTGFTRDQVMTATISLPARYDAPRQRTFIEQVTEQLRAVPGITHAAFTLSLPINNSGWNSIFVIEGQPVPERSQLPFAAWTPVTLDYFKALEIRLIKGRTFDRTDTLDAPRRIIVNQAFARRFFGNDDPLGARVKQGWPEEEGPWREIVGIVNDVRQNGLQGTPPLQVYLPNAQTSMGFGSLVVRSNIPAAALSRAMESAVREIDPNLPLFNVRTMEEIIEGTVGNERLTMILLTGFSGLALLMAAIGVFGVTAYSVSQRTHEVGIRMALGARPSNVLAMILRQEMTACLAGIAVGIGGAVFLSSLLESLLFGVTATDSATLSIAALVLLLVTATACVVPARRATRVDPVTALRLD